VEPRYKSGALAFVLRFGLRCHRRRRRPPATRDQSDRREHSQRSLIEAAPNGIVVVGPRGDIVDVNSSAERLFGYDRAELLGKPVEALVPEKAARLHGRLRQGFGSFILRGSPRQFDGEATLAYESAGLSYELRLPVDSIR
jgi:PAS domain-containing protein